MAIFDNKLKDKAKSNRYKSPKGMATGLISQSQCYNLVCNCTTISAFQVLKSPCSMCLRASPTNHK